MRKKNWLIGSIAAAAVVICGAVGINSVNAADTDAAKSAKEEFVYEQIGLDSYDNVYGIADTWLTANDEKNITIITGDGTVYDLDNTDGKYGNIQVISSANNAKYIGYIYTVDDNNNKITLMNYDGSYAFDNGGYHDNVSFFKFNGTKYMIITDDGKSTVKTEDGTDVTDKLNPDGKKMKTEVGTYLDSYLEVNYGDGYAYFDKNLNKVDVEGKLAQEGYTVSHLYTYRGKYICAYYHKDGSDSTTFYMKYFDADLNPYNDSTPKQFSSIEAEKPSVAIDSSSSSSVYNNYNGKIFTYSLYKSSETYQLEDDYTAAYSGTLLGYKVIQGTKSVDNATVYAMFDENGAKLYDGVMTSSRGDKLVVKSDKSYKIVKVSFKSESGETDIVIDDNKNSVAEVVAKKVDTRDLEDENGNKITVDDLDKDAKSLINNNQTFTFEIKASENVIPEGSKIAVAQVVYGKEYAAAKKVTADKVDKIAVFSIDLLNKDNVQIHEVNGKIEITTDIPKDFDADKIAVYRLSEDGTSYTMLVSKVENGKVTFETDHFSTYMIVQEKADISSDDSDVNPSPSQNDDSALTQNNADSSSEKVKTGDTPVTVIASLIALMCVAGAAMVVTFKKTRA